MTHQLDSVDFINEAEAMAADRRQPKRLLTRAEFCSAFGLTNTELRLLFRRPDFIACCCLTSESGEVVRLIPGQVERWLREGDWTAAAEAARQPTWVAIGAVVAQAFLRAVRKPGGLEEVA